VTRSPNDEIVRDYLREARKRADEATPDRIKAEPYLTQVLAADVTVLVDTLIDILDAADEGLTSFVFTASDGYPSVAIRHDEDIRDQLYDYVAQGITPPGDFL